jgi:Flp pilus assembly protein TadD
MYKAGAAAEGASAAARGDPTHCSALLTPTPTPTPCAGVAYFNLGHLLGGQKEWSEAEEAYRIAMGLNPAHQSAYSNMGKLYADQVKI